MRRFLSVLREDAMVLVFIAIVGLVLILSIWLDRPESSISPDQDGPRRSRIVITPSGKVGMEIAPNIHLDTDGKIGVGPSFGL